jgi:hypothetical protein
MSDDTKNRGAQDRNRISMSQDHEVRYWTRELGVTREELEEVVKNVGNDVAKVREHMRERSGK